MGDKRGDIPVLKPGIELVKPTGPQPEADEATCKLYADSLPKTVQITTNKGRGSGFFMDKDGSIGTAAHVILGSSEQFAITSDGTKYKLRIEKVDDINDLAILRPESFKPGSRPYAELGSTKDLKPDDSIFPMGHPLGLRPAYISPGYFRHTLTQQELIESIVPDSKDTIKAGVESLTPKERPDMQAALARELLNGKVHIRPGDSGGPTYDAAGRVIGINDMITGNKLDAGYLVPVEKMRDLYNSDGKFQFTYNRIAEPWAQEYKHAWQSKPLDAAASTLVAGGVGYLGFKALSRYPRTLGLGAAGYEGFRLVNDVSELLDSTDRRDVLKYGISSAADLSGTVGALAMMSSRYRVGGAVGLAVGIGGRMAADFLPSRLVLTDIQRKDGSILPPFDPQIEKTLGL